MCFSVSFATNYNKATVRLTAPIEISSHFFTFGIVTFAAAIIDGSFVLAASYAGCDAMMVGLFFVISVGSQGFLATSSLMNPMDLSPNFAGTITGLTNGIGSITGIMVPYVIGVLTPNVSRILF